MPDAPLVSAPAVPTTLAGQIGRHGILILLCFVSLFPLYWMVVTSLRPENAIFNTSLWPSTASLANYWHVIDAIPIARMIANTFVISTAAAIGQVITGLLAAYAFVRWRFRFDRIVYGLIALTWLVPFQVTMIPNYVLMSDMGLLDTLAGLAIPHAVAAFAVLLLSQALRNFPLEVMEAARMDGASDWHILWRVITPNITASLVSLAILAFIATWNDYFWPLLLTRTIDNSVVQIGLQMFLTQEGNQWGPLMAASTLASLPIIAVYVLLQRQVIDSFVKSGLK